MPINVRRAFTRPPTWTSTGRGPNSPTVYDRRRYFLRGFFVISPALSNNENQLSQLHPDVEHQQCQWDLVLRQSDLGQRPGETQPVQQAEVTYRGVQSSAQSASRFCGNLAISRHFIPALREADVPRDAVLALGGWANGGTEEICGGG